MLFMIKFPSLNEAHLRKLLKRVNLCGQHGHSWADLAQSVQELGCEPFKELSLFLFQYVLCCVFVYEFYFPYAIYSGSVAFALPAVTDPGVSYSGCSS